VVAAPLTRDGTINMRRQTLILTVWLVTIGGCAAPVHPPPPIARVTELREAYTYTLGQLDDLARAGKIAPQDATIIRQTVPTIDAALDAAERAAVTNQGDLKALLEATAKGLD